MCTPAISRVSTLQRLFANISDAIGSHIDLFVSINVAAIIIIGGMGSIPGAAIGAVLLGLVQSYSSIYLHFGSTDLSPYGVLAQFILVIAVLAIRPLGLFGRPA